MVDRWIVFRSRRLASMSGIIFVEGIMEPDSLLKCVA